MVLYSVSMIGGSDRPRGELRKELLASSLGISPKTLDNYFHDLEKKGLIERKKSKYIKDLRLKTTLTYNGKKELLEIERTIGNLLLTEYRHNIPSCMDLKKVMDRMIDPLDRVFFLALYNHHKFFDLPMFLQTMKISKEDTNPLNMLEGLDPGSVSTRRESFVESFYNASLFGDIDRKLLASEDWNREDIDALIILAEAKIRSGKLEDVKMIHDHILDSELHLTQNQWFIIKIDHVAYLKKKGRIKEATELLDLLENMVDNRVYSAYIKTRKAMIHFFQGNRKETTSLLDTAIKSFSTFGLPIFLAMTHNNRGVTRFISEDFEGAEEDWTLSRRYAREAKSTYAEALVLPNLADIAMRSGKFDLAKGHLEKARSIFKELQDQEGLAVVEFNTALLKVEMGDLGSALDHFGNWESMFQILTPMEEKLVMKNDFIKRCLEKGYQKIEERIQKIEF